MGAWAEDYRNLLPTLDYRGLDRLGLAAEALEERRVQTTANIFGKRDGFGVAEDLDGFAAGVDDDAAVGAAGKMLFEIRPHVGVEDSVKIAG
jgi:hypothetical protein